MGRSDADFREYATARWSNLYRTAYLLSADHPIAAHRASDALARAYVTWPRHGATDSDAHVRQSLVGASASWRTRRRWAHEIGDDGPRPGAESDTTLPAAPGEDVLDALMQLPTGLRAVLVLRCGHDLGPREIADLLAWKPATVMRHAAEGVRRLQALLAQAVRSDPGDGAVPMRQELRDAVQAALAEVSVRPLRFDQVLSEGRSRRNRRRGAALAAVAAAATAVGGIALTQSSSGGAPDATPTAGRSAGQVVGDVTVWEGLGVPWIDGGRIVYGSASLPRPAALTALAASADSVVMTIGQRRATIVELRRDGTLAVIGEDANGIALADTSGRVAAWTQTLDRDSARVVAYDTATHRVIATLKVDRGLQVFALDGRNLVLHDGDSGYRWTAGLPTGLVPFDPGGKDFAVTDMTYSHVFLIGSTEAQLLDRDGNLIESFPRTRVSSGAFDPSGRFVSGLHPSASTGDMSVYDIGNERLVELGVSGDIDWSRWTPESRLVVRSWLPDERLAVEDLPVQYFVCDPWDGRCSPLASGGSTLETAEGVDVGFLGQLAMTAR